MDPFAFPHHFDQIFLPGATRISDSSTSILTSNSSVRNRNRFLLSVLRLGLGCARFCYLELPHILLWDESCHTIQEQRGQRFPNLPPSGTVIGGDAGLAFTTGLTEISFVGAALLCALCVLVLPTLLVSPSARSEGFVLASAQQDWMMKDAGSCCAAGAGSGGTQWQAQRSVRRPPPSGPALALLISRCLFQSHSTCFCVRSQTDTATAAMRCTMPCHDLGRQCTRRCPVGPWSC